MLNEDMYWLEYIRFKIHDDKDTTDGMWCGQMQVPVVWLEGMKRREPDWAKRVLDGKRGLYAKEMLAVDSALIEKAKGGNTQAAELLYRRFENWTPKAAEDALKRNPTNKTFAELIAETEERP
jgi:hypothetical protein